jgi:hypothetical protein
MILDIGLGIIDGNGKLEVCKFLDIRKIKLYFKKQTN